MNRIQGHEGEERRSRGAQFEDYIKDNFKNIFPIIKDRIILQAQFDSQPTIINPWAVWDSHFILEKRVVGQIDLLILNQKPTSQQISCNDIICCIEIKANPKHIHHAQISCNDIICCIEIKSNPKHIHHTHHIQHHKQINQWQHQQGVDWIFGSNYYLIPSQKDIPMFIITKTPDSDDIRMLGFHKTILKQIYQSVWNRGRPADKVYSWLNQFNIDHIDDVKQLWSRLRKDHAE